MNKKGGWCIKIFRRKFFVSQCRNPSQVNPSVLCSRNIPVAKKFMDKCGEYEDFLRKFFLSQWRNNFIGESFTIGVFLGTGKVWITRGGWEYQDVPLIKICLTVPKFFVG